MSNLQIKKKNLPRRQAVLSDRTHATKFLFYSICSHVARPMRLHSWFWPNRIPGSGCDEESSGILLMIFVFNFNLESSKSFCLLTFCFFINSPIPQLLFKLKYFVFITFYLHLNSFVNMRWDLLTHNKTYVTCVCMERIFVLVCKYPIICYNTKALCYAKRVWSILTGDIY